ncbi:MAG: membrane protein insertase YidC [Candidatus Methylomirabilales bacterium]
MRGLGDGDREMQWRVLLAALLSLLILLGYQYLFAPTPRPTSSPPPKEEPVASPPLLPQIPQPITPPVAAQPSTPLIQAEREKEILLETDLLRVVVTNRGGAVKSWRLRAYEEAAGEPVELVGSNGQSGPLPLAAWTADGEGQRGLYRIIERPTAGGPQTVLLRFQGRSRLIIEKRLTLYPSRYLADLVVRVVNPGLAPIQTDLRVQWGPGLRSGSRDVAASLVAATAYVGGKRVQPTLKEPGQEHREKGSVEWAAVQDTYFAAALLSPEGSSESVLALDERGRPIAGLLFSGLTIPAGGGREVPLGLYAGPKDLDRLGDIGRGLSALVNLGWFDFLARPALWLLKFFYRFTGNYGIAIIIITILQKVAFYPLTRKSLESMRRMQALQPKIATLKERYKNNPKKLNEETMALYKREGANPLGGCLPMLVQIPIFIALYNALSSSVELWRAPFVLWISDLSAPDTLFMIELYGSTVPVRVLPLIMGASMYIQQKMTPTAGDPRQAQLMLYMMPVLFTFLFWGFPSGLVLYWLGNNLLQIGQQHLMNRQQGVAAGAGQMAR